MSNELLETHRRALIDAVTSKGPTQGLRGTNARDVLAKNFNPADFGCRNLRQFIQEQVPELKIIGSSGGDVVWGLADWSPLPARAASEVTTGDLQQDSLWRTWVSPLSRKVIVVNLKTSEIFGTPSDAPVEDGYIRIEPLDARAHRDIAQAFLASGHVQDLAMRDALADAIGDTDTNWWNRWNQILHTDSRSFHDWRRYRVEQLRRKLHEYLEALDLPSELTGTIEAAVTTSSRLSSGGGESPVAFARKSDGKHAGTAQVLGVDGLRALVLEVVARMSEEQLRGLTLPTGLLVDAFAHRIPNAKRSLGG